METNKQGNMFFWKILAPHYQDHQRPLNFFFFLISSPRFSSLFSSQFFLRSTPQVQDVRHLFKAHPPPSQGFNSLFKERFYCQIDLVAKSFGNTAERAVIGLNAQ